MILGAAGWLRVREVDLDLERDSDLLADLFVRRRTAFTSGDFDFWGKIKKIKYFFRLS